MQRLHPNTFRLYINDILLYIKNIHVNRKYLRIAGIIFAGLFLLLLIAGYIAYAKREALLQHEITKAKEKAKTSYNLDLEIGSAHFIGLSTVAFNDITIVPAQRDSLLSIKRFEVNVKLMPLLFGEVKLADVLLEDAHLNLTDINHIRNFDFLFKKKKDTTDTGTKVDLAELSNNLINQVLYKIPDNLSMSNFLVTFKTDSSNFSMLTQTATIKNGELSSTLNINNGAATCISRAECITPIKKLILNCMPMVKRWNCLLLKGATT